MDRHRRFGLAVAAAAVLAAAACSSSSSSSGSSSSPATTGPASAPASSPPASTGAGGLGAQSVTNYLTYVGGKAGPADKSLPPVYIGFVNQQGGPTAVGLLATAGAQMAVNYANAELGGIDGHPIQLVTCFIASAEEEGTVCAQKFLANSKVDVIELGGVAIGVQSFFATLGGAKPVIDGVAATPIDSVQKNAVILFGDATHILAPFGTYARDVLHAKTAALVYPSDNAGIAVGAAAIKAGLVAAGLSVKAVGYPETQTDLTSVLTAAGAQTADVVIPYSDTAGCVNLAKSLKTLGITDPKKILSAPLCLNGQVIQGLGDFPHWTYSIASSLFGDPTDPGMPAYEAAAKTFSTPADEPDPWNIVDFGQTLTTIKIMNEVGYASLSPAAILAKAKAFTGPQALGAPALDCGKYTNAPGVCNDQIQFFEYTGGVTSGKPQWAKLAGWLQPPS
ncbi:MAG TPA: ABC transporter substrate-binding protein [Streptosporangiaceae bacterium]|nr:ABC transporter substrate-binding protein [Streptosporangiaceae bacterium]